MAGRLIAAVAGVAVGMIGALVAVAVPAAGAEGRRAFAVDDGFSSSSYPYLMLEAGESVNLEFGIADTTYAQEVVRLAVTAPGISLEVTNAFAGSCNATSSQVECFQLQPSDYHELHFGVRLSVAAGVSPGRAGSVTATTPDGLSDAVPLWIIDRKRGADFEVKGSAKPSTPGGTATVTLTVTNHGPSPDLYWGLGPLDLPGGRIVAQRGCSSGSIMGTAFFCLHHRPVAVGETDTVSFDIALATDNPARFFGPGFLKGLPDLGSGSNLVHLSLLTGSGGSGDGGGNGGGGGNGSGSSPAATPGAVPTVTAQASPSPSTDAVSTDASSTTVVADPAGHRRAAAGLPWVWLGSAAVLVALGVAGGLLRRRRQVAVSTPEPTSPVAGLPPATGPQDQSR